MFLLWGTFALSFIIKYSLLAIAIPLYIFIIICEFCSHKDFFKDQKTPQEIKDIIGKYFTSPGTIQFIRYIYEERTRTNNEGNQERHMMN